MRRQMIGNIKEFFMICHGIIREDGCLQPPLRRVRTRALPREDRERLVAFTALEADADVFGLPGLEKLPAIIWKRRNLETLRRKDARKFTDNAMALERMLL